MMFLALTSALCLSAPHLHASTAGLEKKEKAFPRVLPKTQSFEMSCGLSTVLNTAKLCPHLPNFDTPSERKRVFDLFHASYSQNPAGRLYSQLSGFAADGRRFIDYDENKGAWVKKSDYSNMAGTMVYDLHNVLVDLGAHPQCYLPPIDMDQLPTAQEVAANPAVLKPTLDTMFELVPSKQEALSVINQKVANEGKLMQLQIMWLNAGGQLPSGHWVLAAPWDSLPQSVKHQLDQLGQRSQVVIFDSENSSRGPNWKADRGTTYLQDDAAEQRPWYQLGDVQLVDDNQAPIAPESLDEYFRRLTTNQGAYGGGWALTKAYCSVPGQQQDRHGALEKKSGHSVHSTMRVLETSIEGLEAP